jgi:hypothetical protein
VEECSLLQIPPRLHANGRAALLRFEVGERLYRRCKPDEIENPFAKISLVDLSVNREGPKEVAPLCEPQDVLRDFSAESAEEWLPAGEVAVALEVMEVNEEGTYRYESELPGSPAPATATCVLQLAHDQEPCNYSHSAFKLFLNADEVTFDNYDEKEGLGAKKYRKFRTQCRFELGQMLLKGQIWLPTAA